MESYDSDWIFMMDDDLFPCDEDEIDVDRVPTEPVRAKSG